MPDGQVTIISRYYWTFEYLTPTPKRRKRSSLREPRPCSADPQLALTRRGMALRHSVGFLPPIEEVESSSETAVSSAVSSKRTLPYVIDVPS